MKKLFIPLVFLATFVSCRKSDPTPDPSPTPLVITKADYSINFKAGGIAFSSFQTAAASVTVPSAGENQTWDFSTLAESISYNESGANYLTPTNIAFPTASYGFAASTAWAAGGSVSPYVASTEYTKISDAGVYKLGYSQNAATTITIASLGATINYPAQNLNYTGTTEYPSVLFPAKFGNAPVVTSGLVFTSNYTVNAAAFGLSNTPGQTKKTTTVTSEIIGSGIANFKGIGKVRVLVAKNSYSDKTNYFLGGAPAPAALLTNLGLVDGAITTGATYRFIAENFGTVGFIDVDASGVVTGASFRKS